MIFGKRIESDNINDSFITSLTILRDEGIEINTRGMLVKEICDYSFQIKNPRKRVLTCPRRYNNIIATMAETLWVFSGRNDLKFLKFFLPNSIDYSDNGKTWGGSYGPRLKSASIKNMKTNRYGLYNLSNFDFLNFHNSRDSEKPFIDQIKNLIETLENDQFSRQAIILIPNQHDYLFNLKTKDRPCTIFVQFFIRDGKLHTFTRMRSNDCIWGAYNINVFEWTFLQEIICSILKLKMGTYNHNATSFHYYSDKMAKRVESILDANKFAYNVYEKEFFVPKQIRLFCLAELDSFISKTMRLLDIGISNKYSEYKSLLNLADEIFSIFPKTNLNPFLEIPLSLILAKNFSFKIASDFLLEKITKTNKHNFDYYIAALEYLVRSCSPSDDEINKIQETTKKFFSKDTITFITGRY